MIWSRRARADLDRLYQFLASKSPAAARRAIETIQTQIRLLDAHPRAGRPVGEDVSIDLREWPIDFGNAGYVVLYHIADGEVTILTIRHQSEAGYD